MDAKELYDMLKANGHLIPPELAEMVEGAKRPKYKNKKTYQDGTIYDSRAEADRANDLKLLMQSGEVLNMIPQAPFALTADITYVADFLVFYADGHWDAEDVKSPATRTLAPYRMKRKLFAERYGKEIVEV